MISSKFEGYTWYQFPLQVHLIKAFEVFHEFRVFVLDIRVKNINVELVEAFLQNVL